MKTFALAMCAAVATANSYDPSYRYSGRSSPSYGHSHNSYNQYPTKSYAPSQSHGHYPSQYPSHYHQGQTNQSQYHTHADGSSHAYNPWDQTTSHNSAVPDGWLNPYQQYSKPQIAYKPEVTKPTFAICEMITFASPLSSNIEGNVQIVQIPGKPATAQWNLTSTLALDDPIYARINDVGTIGADCIATGHEFNPLRETDKYGRANPYQDFSRGRFDALAADAASAVDGVIQNYLLQNLGGKNDIIGRSISLYQTALADVVEQDATTGTPTVVEACCIIAIDETPYRWLPQPHYHGQHY